MATFITFLFFHCKGMYYFRGSQIFQYICRMKLDTTTFQGLTKPVYILEEQRLRRNLQLISDVAKAADVEIILAFKAYALWKTFPIFREYIRATTASSLYEAKLGNTEFGAPTHTFSCLYRLRNRRNSLLFFTFSI